MSNVKNTVDQEENVCHQIVLFLPVVTEPFEESVNNFFEKIFSSVL
jgi:hypothetical protein